MEMIRLLLYIGVSEINSFCNCKSFLLIYYVQKKNRALGDCGFFNLTYREATPKFMTK